VAIDAPANSMNMVPEWQRKAAARIGASGQPWKKRGHHTGRRSARLYS
jgi:hypothetical protein